MLKDYITLKTSPGYMWNADDNLFIYPFSAGGITGLPPTKANDFVTQIRQSITSDKQRGRCWIYPVRLGDPDDFLDFKHRAPVTIWVALIPGFQTKSEWEDSLKKVYAWVIETGLPIKIAVDADTFKLLPSLDRLFADILGRLHITVYQNK